MSYYGAGDYYGAGGIGSFLKGAARTAVSFVTGGPVAAARTAVTQLGAPRGLIAPPAGRPVVNLPFSGAPGAGIGSFGTPAHVATVGSRRFYTKDGRPRRIRRDGRPYDIPSMNPGNTKALTRASRRIDKFVSVARSAMKHTNYKVVSKSAGRGKKRK